MSIVMPGLVIGYASSLSLPVILSAAKDLCSGLPSVLHDELQGCFATLSMTSRAFC